jgi:ABC-type enterochelin transport system substrate-binding protein
MKLKRKAIFGVAMMLSLVMIMTACSAGSNTQSANSDTSSTAQQASSAAASDEVYGMVVF